MDRIEQIKHHLQVADGDEATVSKHRWMASELIWLEVNDGKSRRALAEEIGKSHTHVRYMFNCWDMVGRKLAVSGHVDSFPNFQAIYASSEIRGESDPEPDGHGGDRKRRKGGEDSGADYTAHGLVVTAANSLDALARNRAYWPLLTEDDLAVLRTICPTVRALLRDSGR